MYMTDLPPLLSLQIHCYPKCLEELRHQYLCHKVIHIKARQPKDGRQAANRSCSTIHSIVYTVGWRMSPQVYRKKLN